MHQRIAIIGGGWSGLSAAARLCQDTSTARRDVVVFEAAPQLGGRARGLLWEGLPIDNGQHLLLGCYEATRSLLAWAGAFPKAWTQTSLEWTSIRSGSQPLGLRIPSTAWPRRLLDAAQAAPPIDLVGWPLGARWGLAKLLFKARTCGWHASGSAAAWLSPLSLDATVREGFCRPLIEGALNTEWSQASAAVFLRVLKDSIGAEAGATDALHPAGNLSASGINQIASRLETSGVQIQMGSRVSAIHPENTRWRLEGDDQGGLFDEVVFCLSARDTARIWSRSELPGTPEVDRWSLVEPRGIATLWLDWPMTLGRSLPAHRLNAIATSAGTVIVGLARPPGPWGQVLSLVASAVPPASDWTQATSALWEAADLWLAPQAACPIAALRHRITHERHATWACTADAVDSGAAWGRSSLGIKGLWRAGDDLCLGYPATIESAVRSGRQTADLLLLEEGQEGLRQS